MAFSGAAQQAALKQNRFESINKASRLLTQPYDQLADN
jgi:hypothetical protein